MAQPPADAPLPVVFRDMLCSYWVSMSLHVAARLDLADRVKERPKTADELAGETATQPQALYRLLRVLASKGVFAEDETGRFGLTPLASCLVSDNPMSQRALALMTGAEHYGAWAELLYSIRTGKPAFDRVYGKPIFDYLAEHPESASVFDAAMTSVHGAETAAMLDAYDFSGIGALVDVGGGNGSLLSAVLQRYPAMTGIVYDLPHVIERTRTTIAAGGLAGRLATFAGSFFDSVPTGGDAYLMRHIIHDWDDDRALTILRNCRKAMRPQHRLLLVECVLPRGNEPFFGKLLDLNMLVLPGGLERSKNEYRRLYEAAGFRLERIVPTRMEVCVIEGKPA